MTDTSLLFRCRMASFLGFAVFLLLASPALGQSVGFSLLFRPGVRLNTAWLPNSALGSQQGSLGLVRGNMSLIVPLNGGAQLDVANLKAKAFQHFLLCNAGVRQLRGSFFSDEQPLLYNFTLGFSGARFSLNSGLWAYLGTLGMVQPSTPNSSPLIFGSLGVMKIRVRGLGTQDFYGFGAVYNNGRFLPVPLFGIRRKLAKRLHFTALLPAQIDLSYRFKHGHQLALQATWAGFSSEVPRPNNFFPSSTEKWQLQLNRFKTGLTGSLRLNRNWRIVAEGGWNIWQRAVVTRKGANQQWAYSNGPQPYAGLSLRLNLGHSLISSQMFGSD